MNQEQIDKKNLAWLITHNPAFAEAYKIRRRIEREQAANRKKMEKAMKENEA